MVFSKVIIDDDLSETLMHQKVVKVKYRFFVFLFEKFGLALVKMEEILKIWSKTSCRKDSKWTCYNFVRHLTFF